MPSKHRRARVSLNLDDAEFARLQAICKRLGQPVALYVRDLVMGVVEDEFEGLGLQDEWNRATPLGSLAEIEKVNRG